MPGQVPPVADERAGLLGYLAQQRDAVRFAGYGLTEEQIRATPTAGALSVGGLIKHVAVVERGWMRDVAQRNSEPKEGGGQEAEGSYYDSFHLAPDETLAGLLARYDEVAKETETIIAGIADLGEAVPIPKGVPWFPDDVDAWSVRWVLLHLIEETARHAGHADIIRESIDGATAYALMAAAESWEPTPWLQPWQPPTAPE